MNRFIKYFFKKVKFLVIFRGHLRYPILNISHKHILREIFRVVASQSKSAPCLVLGTLVGTIDILRVEI